MPDRSRDALFVAFDPFRPRHSRYAQRRSDDVEQSPIPSVYAFHRDFRYGEGSPVYLEPRPASDYEIMEGGLESRQYHASNATIPRISIPAPNSEPYFPVSHSQQERPPSAASYEYPSSYFVSRPTYTPWYGWGPHEVDDRTSTTIPPESLENHLNSRPPLPDDGQSGRHSSSNNQPNEQFPPGDSAPVGGPSENEGTPVIYPEFKESQLDSRHYPLPMRYMQHTPQRFARQGENAPAIPDSQESRSPPHHVSPRPFPSTPHGVISDDFSGYRHPQYPLSTISERSEGSSDRLSRPSPPIPYDEHRPIWQQSFGDYGWETWPAPQPWPSFVDRMPSRIGFADGRAELGVPDSSQSGPHNSTLRKPEPVWQTPSFSFNKPDNPCNQPAWKLDENIGASRTRYILVLLFESIPQQIYLHFLLRLPSLYFSRVARVFEDAELSLSDIEKMAAMRMEEWHSHSKVAERIPSHALWDHDEDHVSPALRQFKSSWEDFVGSLIKEWKVLNVISALLASAILSLLQLDAAMADVVTKSTALLSLVCSLMSLLYCCMYIIRFGTMRKMHKAASWADEARQTKTRIIWNVWVMLAMPAVWLCWAVVLFLASIMSFVWRSALSHGGDGPKEAFQEELGPPVAISTLLVIGLCYFIQLIGTFRRYGDLMDRIWRDRLLSKWTRSRYLSPIGAQPVPLRSPRQYPVQEFYPTQITRSFDATDRQPSPPYPPYPWNEVPPRRPSPVQQSHPTYMYPSFEPKHSPNRVKPRLLGSRYKNRRPSRHSSPPAILPDPSELESQQDRCGFKDLGNTSDKLISAQCSPSLHRRGTNSHEPIVDGNLTKDISSAEPHSESNSLHCGVAGVDTGAIERTEHIISDPGTTKVDKEQGNSKLSLLDLTIHEL